jgi:hypothetical protein
METTILTLAQMKEAYPDEWLSIAFTAVDALTQLLQPYDRALVLFILLTIRPSGLDFKNLNIE